MAARLEQDAKRRAEKEPAPVVRTAMLRSALSAILQELSARKVELDANLLPHMPFPAEVQGTALWRLGSSDSSLHATAVLMSKRDPHWFDIFRRHVRQPVFLDS